MTDPNAYQRAAQARSLAKATRRGAAWTQREIALLEDRALTAEQLAAQLERTAYAVSSARHLLASGHSLGGGHGVASALTRRVAAAEAVGYDYVTTFPPGDRD